MARLLTRLHGFKVALSFQPSDRYFGLNASKRRLLCETSAPYGFYFHDAHTISTRGRHMNVDFA